MSDLDTLKESSMYMKKELTSFVKAEEFITRFNIYQSEFNEKLSQKAT